MNILKELVLACRYRDRAFLAGDYDKMVKAIPRYQKAIARAKAKPNHDIAEKIGKLLGEAK